MADHEVSWHAMTMRDPSGATGDVRTETGISQPLAILAGPAMAVAFVGGTALASVTGQPVHWTEQGFNDLGSVLHASIITGSLLGIVFLWPVWTDASHVVQRGGIILFGIALSMMVGVNAAEIAYEDLPVAAEFLGLGFLFVLPFAWLVHGIGDVAAGYRQRGFASLMLWLVYFSVWVYSFQMGSVTVLVGFIWLTLASAWALVQFASIRGNE